MSAVKYCPLLQLFSMIKSEDGIKRRGDFFWSVGDFSFEKDTIRHIFTHKLVFLDLFDFLKISRWINFCLDILHNRECTILDLFKLFKIQKWFVYFESLVFGSVFWWVICMAVSQFCFQIYLLFSTYLSLTVVQFLLQH